MLAHTIGKHLSSGREASISYARGGRSFESNPIVCFPLFVGLSALERLCQVCKQAQCPRFHCCRSLPTAARYLIVGFVDARVPRTVVLATVP